MKNHILLILVFSLVVSTSCTKVHNVYTVNEMLSQASFQPNYSRKSGFFMHPDSTKAVWVPRGKNAPVKIYQKICNHFIYIP